MKQDRALFVILGVILVLILASLLLFFLRPKGSDYVSDDTPQGVTRNYILAVLNEDYQKAYDYLNDAPGKPTYSEFKSTFVSERPYTTSTGVQIGTTDIIEDEAFVELTIIHGGSAPFESTWNESGDAWLVSQEGRWQLTYFPYPFWGWNWYSESP